MELILVIIIIINYIIINIIIILAESIDFPMAKVHKSSKRWLFTTTRVTTTTEWLFRLLIQTQG